MKCRNMGHFIWVFTVCQSTRFGVSHIQRVKGSDKCQNFVPALYCIKLEFHYCIKLEFHYCIKLEFHYCIKLEFHYCIKLEFHYCIKLEFHYCIKLEFHYCIKLEFHYCIKLEFHEPRRGYTDQSIAYDICISDEYNAWSTNSSLFLRY